MESNDKMKVIDISPYDEAFPISLLSEAFNFQLNKAEKAAVTICNDIEVGV